MGAQSLSSRAVIGSYYRKLNENTGMAWAGAVSMPFDSDQASEEYRWLGMAPQMREWLGGRLAKGLRDNGVIIKNKYFEATLEVLVEEIRRDKTGQVMVRINDLARRTNSHWVSLLSTLIIAGETTGLAYDGQLFFDTDHVEDDSGVQSNDITVATVSPGTATAPTASDFERAILRGAETILGQKDNQGEPMNEDASRFLVMVPTVFMSVASAALKNPVISNPSGTGAQTNTLVNLGGFGFDLAINPRLTWTTKFAMFRTDSDTKPFIRQEEQGVRMDAVAEGSEEEFKNRRHLYGVTASRNVGYGLWQDAVLVTLT